MLRSYSLAAVPFELQECRLKITAHRNADAMVHPIVSAGSLHGIVLKLPFPRMYGVHGVRLQSVQIKPGIRLAFLT